MLSKKPPSHVAGSKVAAIALKRSYFHATVSNATNTMYFEVILLKNE